MENTDSHKPNNTTRHAMKTSKPDRRNVLLRAAYDLLTKADREHFVEQATMIVTRYDSANCDGGCLREDIADELRIDPETDPIPLEAEDYSPVSMD